MKKSLKYFALLFMGLAIVGCSDEDFADGNRKSYHSGDAIAFGVSASVPAGNDNAKNSRTSYGDHSVDPAGNGLIAINWEEGDLLDIACPEASASQLATYRVPTGGKTTANGLELFQPEVGLRWNGEGDHHFYGIYPSNEVFSNVEKYPADMLEKPSFKLEINENSKKAVGFMPMNYTAKMHEKQTHENGHSTYTITPNMDYAFMVANKQSNLKEVNQSGLALKFQPLATVLEFEIVADLMTDGVVAGKDKTILLDHVELSSNNINLSGQFEYDFNNGTLTNTSKEGRTNMNLYMNYKGIDVEKQGVKLADGDTCKINFFMLPESDLAPKDLKVRLWFIVDGKYTRQRVAVIGRPISVKHKYMFRNFKMPQVKLNVQGSTWFSAVDDDAMMNQISMICAGNAFSSIQGIPWYSREQVLDYKTLWNEGVRAFEFVTQSCNNAAIRDWNGDPKPAWGLRDEHFVCGELEMDGEKDPWNTNKNLSIKSETFGTAFASLAKFLILDQYKDYHNETLMLITRYHAVNDGYSPERYVKNLADFLTYASTHGVTDDEGNTFMVPESKYVLLTANSTAKDLKGKIAIIVRPGDDVYCEKNKVTKTDAAYEQLGEWKNLVCYVQNWGSAYDRWDMRYPGYAREATWNKEGSGLKNMEDNLWAVGRTTGTHGAAAPQFELLWRNSKDKTTVNDFDFKSLANLQAQPNFLHTINGKEGKGVIQEWARVVPEDFAWKTGKIPANINGKGHNDEVLELDYTYKTGTGRRDNKTGKAYLWYQWKSSYQEKVDAIKQVFQESVKRVGTPDEPLCVNVLSGYFVDERHSNSFEPFIENIHAQSSTGGTGDFNIDLNFTARNQGNGGNYAALAARLNADIFEYLTSNILPAGPWGVVQVDFLGATAQQFQENSGLSGSQNLHGADAAMAADASRRLMQLFVANNFSFALGKAQGSRKTADLEIDSKNEPIITE